MNQGAITVNWTDTSGVAHQTLLQKILDYQVNSTLPVVLLLHGLNGDINHMCSPDVSPGMNYNLYWTPPDHTDLGWHAYPNVGLYGLIFSPKRTVTGWQPYLAQLGYLTFNYAQIAALGKVEDAAVELEAVVRYLLGQYGKRILFVCHSRGGLLFRTFLQRVRNDIDVLTRIGGAYTLHTPHQGSQVADVAMAIHDAVTNLRGISPDSNFRAALDAIDDQVNHTAIVELSPTSSVITGLRQQETQPLNVPVTIHTSGGTNPRLFSMWESWFDASSAIPCFNLPPFRWTTYPSAPINFLDGTPVADICPEERHGGDVLVTEVNSRLPWEASHGIRDTNHAAALWDSTEQDNARSKLNEMIPGGYCTAQSFPQTMSPGVSYPVSFTMRNGAARWLTAGTYPYRLGLWNPQDSPVWGVNRRNLSGLVPPYSEVKFDFNVTAPSVAGQYHFQWRMLQEGVEWFGSSSPDILITVGQLVRVGHLYATPTSIVSGQNLTVTIELVSPASPAGMLVNLSSSNAAVVNPPATVAVPGNAPSRTITVPVGVVKTQTSVTLTASAGGGTASATVTVNPAVSQYPYGTQATAVGGSLM